MMISVRCLNVIFLTSIVIVGIYLNFFWQNFALGDQTLLLISFFYVKGNLSYFQWYFVPLALGFYLILRQSKPAQNQHRVNEFKQFKSFIQFNICYFHCAAIYKRSMGQKYVKNQNVCFAFSCKLDFQFQKVLNICKILHYLGNLNFKDVKMEALNQLSLSRFN